jgi:hypothetical protein
MKICANRALLFLLGAGTLGTLAAAPTPPILTVTANPAMLWPPDGRMVQVTVSGAISGGNLAPQATFSVRDEYGSIQPSVTITIGAGGSFSFEINLQASRDGQDTNGRRYSITVSASNPQGSGFGTAVVVVPHDSSPLPSITGITVCSATGPGGATQSCEGLLDTHQPVLAPVGTTCSMPDANGRCPIDEYQDLGATADEHSTIFPPGTIANNDYLFWVATGTTASSRRLGAVALSGGSGPDQNGQWTLSFAPGYGAYPAGYGPVFLPPVGETCPTVSDKTQQDGTFDLSYAAPGTVFKDPSSNYLLMLYEGVNVCSGVVSGNPPSNAYISVGIATSADNGETWPVYKSNFVSLPFSYTTGPNAGLGAFGNDVCDADCNLAGSMPATYGRYAAVTPESTLSSLIQSGRFIGDFYGYGEPSAFVDAVSGDIPYVYAITGYKPLTIDPPLPNAQASDLVLARAALNGGASPLDFGKWDGQAFAGNGMGGVASPILPLGAYQNCGDPSQGRHMGSIEYVESTGQYLLTFVCDSPTWPKMGPVANPPNRPQGSAWFYSTSYDLSDPAQWSIPQEITGSWNEYEMPGRPFYKGWYATWMTPGLQPGHLSTTGHVFYLYGATGGGGGGRTYSSRTFVISTSR